MKHRRTISLLIRFFFDSKTSLLPKLLAGIALLYALWPADLLPDIPILGWLDDAGFLALAYWYLSRHLHAYEKKQNAASAFSRVSKTVESHNGTLNDEENDAWPK